MAETRIIVQELGPDGEWVTIGIAGLSGRDASQIGLILAGVDPAVYASLSPAAQDRVDRNIQACEPPVLAMD